MQETQHPIDQTQHKETNHRTKEMARILINLNVNTPVLIVTEFPNEEVIRSAKNLKRVRTLPAKQLNTLDLLNHDKILITVDAVRCAEKLWAIPTTDTNSVAKRSA